LSLIAILVVTAIKSFISYSSPPSTNTVAATIVIPSTPHPATTSFPAVLSIPASAQAPKTNNNRNGSATRRRLNENDAATAH
jgi:hypothetical protein